jgi:hypothetical protein
MSAQGEQFQQYSQNLLDAAPFPWNTEAPSLWSLLDMLKAYAHTFTMIDYSLGQMVEQGRIAGGVFAADIEARKAVESALKDVRESVVDRPELDAFRDHIDRLLPKLGPPYPDLDLATELSFLRDTLHGGLRRMSFLYLPPLSATTYTHPLAGFSATIKAFPSTAQHIRDGVRCHVFGLYTASVYHSMAIAQVGLHALAKELKVELACPIELAEWQKIIEKIEKKVEPERHTPRTTDKDDKLSFYSACAVQFRYFKDAWRNHVAHMREIYDEGQSFTICLHVRDFMEKLSTRIKETDVNK